MTEPIPNPESRINILKYFIIFLIGYEEYMIYMINVSKQQLQFQIPSTSNRITCITVGFLPSPRVFTIKVGDRRYPYIEYCE